VRGSRSQTCAGSATTRGRVGRGGRTSPPRLRRTSLRALACPASFKGVLAAADAAAALREGLAAGGAEALELPVADGGEGTADALARALGGTWRETEVSDPLGRPVRGRWLELPDGRAVVEAAAAIGLPLLEASERDPLVASSRGFGELIAAALAGGATGLVLGLGGSATVDGGAGLLEALPELTAPATVLCDVSTRLGDAARLFGPQKGASPADVTVLEQRLAAMEELRPYADLPGAGAAGGLGAALAARGARLVPGADALLDLVGFDGLLAGCDLAVTGEGSVDVTTAEGKAPGAVARRCAAAGVRCVVAGGIVTAAVEGAETVALSGDPARCAADLRELGRRLAG
jgi:glycerate kinase